VAAIPCARTTITRETPVSAGHRSGLMNNGGYVAVVRALAWPLRVGGAWRALPPGLVPWRTVYGWDRGWQEQGLFDALLRHVAVLRRKASGRKAQPRLAVIDTQSVKSAFRAAKAPVIPVREVNRAGFVGGWFS